MRCIDMFELESVFQEAIVHGFEQGYTLVWRDGQLARGKQRRPIPGRGDMHQLGNPYGLIVVVASLPGMKRPKACGKILITFGFEAAGL